MLVGSNVGLIHLIASILALIFGTWILVTEKGTSVHRKVGYLYAVSMGVLIVTAFLIYRLFGSFGLFHIAAAVSAVTLVAGMVPVITRRPRNNWLGYHFSFMFWSVLGLYAAFMAETLTRTPHTPFFQMVGIATGGVMLVGYIAFFFYKKKWSRLAALYQNNQANRTD